MSRATEVGEAPGWQGGPTTSYSQCFEEAHRRQPGWIGDVPRRRLTRLFLAPALLLGVVSCGAPQNPKAGQGGPPRPDAAVLPRSDSGAHQIVGEVERIAARRRMKIWGKVEAIRKGKHGELPPLTTTAKGGVGDPVTEIRNQTPGQLTVWFAGKCSHQVDVPATANVTAVFCPGTYNIAAMLEDKNFLPLVREDQEFIAGMQYRLDFFVEKPPSVTKKKAR